MAYSQVSSSSSSSSSTEGIYGGEAGVGLAGGVDLMFMDGVMGGAGRVAAGRRGEEEADYLDPSTHWTEEDTTDEEEMEGEAAGVSGGATSPTALSSHSSSTPLVLGATVDCARDRYPYCIVWSPLPMITWLCPIIGHMGICDSRGVIWDFQGPYSIGRDDMAFGRPTRYIQLDPRLAKAFVKSVSGGNRRASDKEVRTAWDKSVHHTNCHYSKRMHNICCQNCHHHTARAMNQMGYRGMSSWNQFYLAFWVFFCGRFRSASAVIFTFAPFCTILGLFLMMRYAGM